ncbi:MAG: hypothetical protein DRJ10_19605, partial [Bacteroidetes bacterium]
ATEKYTNPYYFDTEGKNKIRSKWAVDQQSKKAISPQIEVIWEVYVDGLAPTSKLDYKKTSKYYDGKNSFLGSNLSINIKSIDDNSGLDQVYFSLNGENYKPVSGAINVDREGDQILKYYAVDKVGNVEKEKEKKFTLDLSPPKTYYNITGISDGDVIALSTKIYLSAKDSLSGVAKTFYRIDNDKEVLYRAGSKIPISNLKDGNHELHIYSIDKVNNKEEETIVKFYLDRTAPIIAADILGDRYLMGEKIFFSGRTKMKLTAVDNKAGVENILYSVNGGKFTNYENPFYLPTVQGTHIVKYYAIDKMKNNSGGNSSKYEKYKHVISRIYVDLTGPILSQNITGPTYKTRDTLFISKETKLKFTAIDKESGLQYISYSLDGNPDEIKYDGAVQIDEPGFHKLVYYGYDNVNNRNRAELTFFVDSAGPAIKYNYSIASQGVKLDLPVYPFHVILYLGATDQTIGTKELFYSINKGTLRSYSFSVSGFKRNKINTVDIKARDYLNNETNLELKFYIE